MATKYIERGLSVIPIQNKNPITKVVPYREKYATPDELADWFLKPGRNIAIVCGKLSNLTVIDCDTDEAVQAIKERLPVGLTPMQSTPHGMHFFFKYDEKYINKRYAPGVDIRTQGAYVVVDPSVNAEGRAWQWVNNILEIEPRPMPVEIEEYLLGKPGERNLSKIYTPESIDKMFEHGERDHDLFHVCLAMVKGGLPEAEVLKSAIIFGKGCHPPLENKEIQEKVRAAFSYYNKRSVAEGVRQWIMSSPGVFSRDKIKMDLRLFTREEQQNLWGILDRMVEKGELERYGKYSATYRLPQKEFMTLDPEQVQEQYLDDIVWPLGLNERILTVPKSVTIVAGQKNAGKTAFCLNFARDNIGKMPITYISSELGATMLRIRLKKFDIPLETWRPVKWIYLAKNFSDAIDPAGLNIVDFLEIYDEFWLVGAWIADIFNKLTTGIALIAMQLYPGREVAKGGYASKEKANLYLTMTRTASHTNQIRIAECKLWRDDLYGNPTGLTLIYKLFGGCKFQIESDWSIPMEEGIKT